MTKRKRWRVILLLPIWWPIAFIGCGLYLVGVLIGYGWSDASNAWEDMP
jgi:hypothetical protein